MLICIICNLTVQMVGKHSEYNLRLYTEVWVSVGSIFSFHWYEHFKSRQNLNAFKNCSLVNLNGPKISNLSQIQLLISAQLLKILHSASAAPTVQPPSRSLSWSDSILWAGRNKEPVCNWGLISDCNVSAEGFWWSLLGNTICPFLMHFPPRSRPSLVSPLLVSC